MTKKTLTVYLAKVDVKDYDDVLSDNTKAKLKKQSTQIIDEPTFGDGAKLYVFSAPPKHPAWMDDLQQVFNVKIANLSASAAGVAIAAVLAFRVDDRILVSTFGHGWNCLEDNNIEGSFGLRVAINLLQDTKLKRLERANLGDASKGITLSPFQKDLNAFGVDDALDLVKKLSGQSRDQASSDNITGSKSVKIHGDYEFADLPAVAKETLMAFSSKAYQSTAFAIMDEVYPVLDKRLVGQLDDEVVKEIQSQTSEAFELALPLEHLDDEVGFKFSGCGNSPLKPDLLMKNYLNALGNELQHLDSSKIREHKVRAIFDDSSMRDRAWPIRKALVGSIDFKNARYAINEGEWYRIDQGFKDAVESSFSKVVKSWEPNEKPEPFMKVTLKGKDSRYEREDDYNKRMSEKFGYINMDKKLINAFSSGRTGFEACDLLDIEKRRFIHVKKSSRRSSVLSHFFKQGANAAQNFARYPYAWSDLIEKVKPLPQAGEMLVKKLVSNKSERWTVEYWISDTVREDGRFNIPFFSKISLRDEVINMRAMQFDVAVRFIKQV